MLKKLRQVFSRTIVLYAGALILLWSMGDFPRAWNHVVTTTLSRYMPGHDYLIDFNQDREKFDFKKNKEFELYYKKLAMLMPELPEAQAMLGFCYFYDGQKNRAMAAYEHAARIYPNVFNFYYNQGVIALSLGDKKGALDAFKKSLDVPVIQNLQYIMISRVYHPLLPNTKVVSVLAEKMGSHSYDIYQRAYWEMIALAEDEKDYQTILYYSRLGVMQGFIDHGTGNYYAGVASYALHQYQDAAIYMREAVQKGFVFAQAFEMMGRSLQAMRRPESQAVWIAATSLTRDKKVFKPPVPKRELLIY